MAVAELTSQKPRCRPESKPTKRRRRTGCRPGRLGNTLVELLTAVQSLSDDDRYSLAGLIRAIAADVGQARSTVAAMRRSEAAAVQLPEDLPCEPLSARPNPRTLVGAALLAVPNGNGRQLAAFIARQFAVIINPQVVSAEAAVLRRRAWDGRLDLSARRLAELVRLVEVIGGDQVVKVIGLVSR